MKKLMILLFAFLLPLQLLCQPEEGLVAHWSFDRDTDSVVADSGPNGFDGQSENVHYVAGPLGRAVVFDSPRDRIHIPAKGEAPPAAIADLQYGSISVWFSFQSVGAQILPILYFGESEPGTPHNSLIIEIGHANNPTNRKLYFTIVNRRFCYDSGENLLENTWYHFVAVVGPDGNTGYLNGKPMYRRRYNLGSDSTYTDFFADVPVREMLSIGYGRFGQQDPFFTYKGMIDELRIYDKPLDQQEVLELFEMGDVNSPATPDFEDVAYGPYDRNVLDFWKADGALPAPLIIYIHGGGFAAGDKTGARQGRMYDYLKRSLDSGCNFAAINYRFRQTTRLDTIMMDCARAVQFLRSKADEWGIEKDKLAAFGGSAGGGATIWLAFNDDRADPENPDPVLRESTRLTVAGHLNSQATYDMAKWAEIIGISENWMEEMNNNEDLELYHISDRSQYDDPEIVALRHFLDMPAFIDETDPPMFFQSMNENSDPENSGHVIHHPRHPIYLKGIYDELGLESAIDLAVTPDDERVDMLEFFFHYLFEDPGDVSDKNKSGSIRISPNPASNFIIIQVPEPFAPDWSIDIYDLTGNKAVYELVSINPFNAKVNTENLHSGVYFLTIRNSGKIYRKMFVVD